MNSYLKAMRIERWPRSLAIFVGVFFYLLLNRNNLGQIDLKYLLVYSLFAFILTGMVSVVNYIINEIADFPFDSHHPAKKERPLLKGEVNKKSLIFIAISLLLVSFIISVLFFSLYFHLSLFSLFIAGILYNLKPFRVKDIPYFDSILESANNPIRFLIGWFSLEPEKFPPLIPLIFWWLFGNFLLSGKRISELKYLGDERAKNYRKSFNGYKKGTLNYFMILSGLLFFILYIQFSVEIKNKLFIFSIPFVFIFLLSFSYKVLKGGALIDEPESLIKDKLFFFLILLIFIFIFFSLFVK
ncbi:MAG: UbiA family prenyltransferase [Acidobacteriota bacterium]